MTDDTPPTRKTYRVLLEEEQQRHSESRDMLNQLHAENMRLKATLQLAVGEAFVEAVRTLEQNFDLSRVVYDVRESEGLGWEGPKVKAVGEAINLIQLTLKSRPASKGGAA